MRAICPGVQIRRKCVVPPTISTYPIGETETPPPPPEPSPDGESSAGRSDAEVSPVGISPAAWSPPLAPGRMRGPAAVSAPEAPGHFGHRDHRDAIALDGLAVGALDTRGRTETLGHAIQEHPTPALASLGARLCRTLHDYSSPLATGSDSAYTRQRGASQSIAKHRP